jgi:4-aminobutyrate aminotransferase-like enzyme
VLDRSSREPATAACAEARDYALECGLLVEFGGLGANVFKFKPPLTTTDDDIQRMLDGAEKVIAWVDEKVKQGGIAGMGYGRDASADS